MERARSAQLNIRSRFARERAADLARQTGMTTTQVVEEALRAFHPPGPKPAPDGMVWKGRILVQRATGRTITLEETLASIDEDRNERGLCID
ncbi:hypothetical protein HZ989_11785 [Brevundimonas sp. AJA228-03]|uniref:hypothetical protein n=1 Tax=Brevundimonas sp. AJA228-03 TaxID=2752515 RepID=UPI001ADFDCEC|nr:hypothetical protein [Brevundimonas sp. AJA228-03]QTN18909.1 hypothetical protein HZ989_11785 [Brevundimonas sp. AJA228-03]